MIALLMDCKKGDEKLNNQRTAPAGPEERSQVMVTVNLNYKCNIGDGVEVTRQQRSKGQHDNCNTPTELEVAKLEVEKLKLQKKSKGQHDKTELKEAKLEVEELKRQKKHDDHELRQKEEKGYHERRMHQLPLEGPYTLEGQAHKQERKRHELKMAELELQHTRDMAERELEHEKTMAEYEQEKLELELEKVKHKQKMAEHKVEELNLQNKYMYLGLSPEMEKKLKEAKLEVEELKREISRMLPKSQACALL